jgi:hypothetical protein
LLLLPFSELLKILRNTSEKLKNQYPMTDQEKKIDLPEKAGLEEEVNTNETDDMNLFIRKTKLQNRILKKMTENLEQSFSREIEEQKSKS